MASKAYECWNEYWADVESNEDYSALTFYHGTSDALDISCILPAAETGFLREDWRKKLTDKVFLTDSLYSAQKYAKKACSKFGGNPVVYVVRPVSLIEVFASKQHIDNRIFESSLRSTR